jgi:hypothetical protein
VSTDAYPAIARLGAAPLWRYYGSLFPAHRPARAAGVGPLRDGDRVAVEIERVGRLEVTVSGVDAVPYADRPVPTVGVAGGHGSAAARCGVHA